VRHPQQQNSSEREIEMLSKWQVVFHFCPLQRHIPELIETRKYAFIARGVAVRPHQDGCLRPTLLRAIDRRALRVH